MKAGREGGSDLYAVKQWTVLLADEATSRVRRIHMEPQVVLDTCE